MVDVQETKERNPAMEVPEPADVIEQVFTYHPPTGDQPERYKRIRESAMAMARVIDKDCPPGADRTAAIRHLSEAVMTANAAIARRGASYR